MPGNRVLRREKLLPVRHVRSAPLPWLDEMMTERDPDCRKMPAKVYPVADNAQQWLVEAPVAGTAGNADIRIFTGSIALMEALEYAHHTFGGAVFLSR